MRSAATIFAKYPETLACFYETCFGLEVADAADDLRVLESDDWTLSIVRVPPEVAVTITLADPPIRREATPIKLSFEVPSIATAQAAIIELGGRVDGLEWEFRGYRHCDFVDPEGNVNQLREAVTTNP
jgi:predicted enzyme related to lactoylglutathione lyase